MELSQEEDADVRAGWDGKIVFITIMMIVLGDDKDRSVSNDTGLNIGCCGHSC